MTDQICGVQSHATRLLDGATQPAIDSLLYEYKGFTFMSTTVPRKNLEDLETFRTRQDDIFLATFPRSGMHWMTEMVLLVLADGNLEEVNRDAMDQVFEMTLPIDPNKPPVTGYKVVEEWPTCRPRVMLSHLSAEFLPLQARQGKGAKVIYMARNVLDNIASRFSFRSGMNLLPPELQDWSNFVQFSLSDKVEGGCWFHHVLSYWKLRESNDNVLFLKFEDTKKDPRSTVQEIATFLGCPLTAEKIDRVVELTSFKNMKKTYAELEKAEPTKLYRTRAFTVEPFLRKGEVGNWKGRFTEEQLEAIRKKTEEAFKGSGLTFDLEI